MCFCERLPSPDHAGSPGRGGGHLCLGRCGQCGHSGNETLCGRIWTPGPVVAQQIFLNLFQPPSWKPPLCRVFSRRVLRSRSSSAPRSAGGTGAGGVWRQIKVWVEGGYLSTWPVIVGLCTWRTEAVMKRMTWFQSSCSEEDNDVKDSVTRVGCRGRWFPVSGPQPCGG